MRRNPRLTFLLHFVSFVFPTQHAPQSVPRLYTGNGQVNQKKTKTTNPYAIETLHLNRSTSISSWLPPRPSASPGPSPVRLGWVSMAGCFPLVLKSR